MKKFDIDKSIKVLGMILKDMENDASEFEGLPFNGKNVSTYFGRQGAAIAALANNLKLMLLDQKEKEDE